MTCIVGVRDGSTVYMGGDGMTEFGNLKRTKCKDKVFRIGKHGEYLIGNSGMSLMNDVLRYSFDPPKSNDTDPDRHMRTVFVDALHKAMKGRRVEKTREGSKEMPESVFMVAYQSRLYIISYDYSVCNAGDFDAIGSGEEFAIGSLRTTADWNWTHDSDEEKSAVERIELALEISAEYNTGVSPPFIILGTDGYYSRWPAEYE